MLDGLRGDDEHGSPVSPELASDGITVERQRLHPSHSTRGAKQPMTTHRVDPRTGYDLWGSTYDSTPNPVVAMDQRITPALLDIVPGERVLDAGCGTGRYIPRLLAAGATVSGMDFSTGMLAVARERFPAVELVPGDLLARWPFGEASFNAVLCALVGEHLDDLHTVAGEMARVLAPGGRAVFSVYHPAMSAAGKEAHFRRDGIEYRLGAVHHELDGYRTAFEAAGFTAIEVSEHLGDEALVTANPGWERYLGFPMLVVFRMTRP
jgi:SAM-dependent methyltransferase